MRLLLAGFPCTKFSVCQKKDRETKPCQGEGWELFYNVVIAKEKFKPDYIILENNASISQEIKDAVTEHIGFGYIEINSGLVNAKQRKRVYWVGKRQEDGTYQKVAVSQTEDRHILLKYSAKTTALSGGYST